MIFREKMLALLYSSYYLVISVHGWYIHCWAQVLMIHQNKYKMEMEKHLLCLVAGLKFQWFLLLQDISIIMEK